MAYTDKLLFIKSYEHFRQANNKIEGEVTKADSYRSIKSNSSPNNYKMISWTFISSSISYRYICDIFRRKGYEDTGWKW